MAIKPVEILITAKDKASGVFDLLKKNAVSLGATLAAYFGFRSFVGAVEGAAELEAKLSEVKAVAGATADDMVLLRKAAEDAGATTKFSATEGADALGNLARAGLSVKDSIAALPPTLQLAQAGQIGLAESAEIVTRTLAGFGLQASDSGRIADVLAKGANASNTSVNGLAQALSYAGPTAKSLNLSLETTVALLGKFADGGIDASRGGTALNAILSQFLDPASKFRTELAAMGITTNDFEAALKQLAAAGPAGQKAILAVGTEAGPALRALLNQGIGAFDDLKKKLQGASGSAAEFARLVEDNTTGAALGLASAWDTVKIALATPVLPVIKDGIQELTGALREAVSNGTVGKFGDAIAKGFQAALTWGRAFIKEVDIDALGAKFTSAATQVGDAFAKLETYATNTGNGIKLIWGVMSAGANTVLGTVYLVGSAFTGVLSNIQAGTALMYQALAKVTFGDLSARYKLAADEIKLEAGATWAASEALGQKATESLYAIADGAQLARDGWAGLTEDSTAAASQAATSEAVFKQVGETLKEVGGDAEALGMSAKAMEVYMAEAFRKSRAEAEALKQEYEAALKAGDVQLAVTKLQQMGSALKSTGDQAKATAQDVANAFERMGIKSKDELTRAAENAKRDFQLIKDSGKATADGLQQAFKSYAEAAIAANGGVATEAIKFEASMRGLSITSDATGKAIVNAATKAATAVGTIGTAAQTSATQFAGAGQNIIKTAEDIALATAKAFGQGTVSQGQLDAAAKQNAQAAKKYASPLGNNKYAGPAGGSTTGNTREERLAGQGASDETLRFALAQKLQAGTLTADDLGGLKTVLQTLKNNQAIFDTLPAGMTSLEGFADDQKWKAIATGFEQAIARFSGGSGGQAIGRTVNVKIDTGAGTETVNTDESGAKAMVKALSAAARRAGR